MNNSLLPVLIIGAGSAGERHIRNLWNTGYHNLIVYRQRNLPFRDIAGAKPQIVLHWEDVLKKKPFAAFICTPTSQHVQQAISCLQNDMHVFVEKPLSHTLENFDELKNSVNNKNKILQVGYMLRFHPTIKKIKLFADEKIYGKLISFHTHWGHYLPDWHPWENYRESYAAKKEYGGGAALTLSHDIDLANLIAHSAIKKYSATFNHAGFTDIDVESGADFLIQYENGVTGHVHVNFYQRTPKRLYQFHFENADIEFDYLKNEMHINTPDGIRKECGEYFDRNSLFIEEVNDFFNKIAELNNYTLYGQQQIRESEIIIKMCNERS